MVVLEQLAEAKSLLAVGAENQLVLNPPFTI